MLNELKIEELFVVDGKTFYSREDAQEYINEIQQLQEEGYENNFNETIYYANCTSLGEKDKHNIVRARWQTFNDALIAMKNFSNTCSPMGTGWIEKVTITTNDNKGVNIQNERVYENM